MTTAQKMALLALVLALALVVCCAYTTYAGQYKTYGYGLAVVLVVVALVLWCRKSTPQPLTPAHREGFTVTPTYLSTDFERTVVAPTYAEEWAIKPRSYDIVSATAQPSEYTLKSTSPPPRAYPYGQYLTQTNLLPNDEEVVQMMCGGASPAREYANSAFLRNDLAFRENISRIHKKKLERRFRQNCNDNFSPYNSY